jgi:hypothetical protein
MRKALFTFMLMVMIVAVFGFLTLAPSGPTGAPRATAALTDQIDSDANSDTGPPLIGLSWSFGATIPRPHQQAAGVVTRGMLYVISGADQSCSDTGGGTPTTAVDIYHPATNRFKPGPDVNIARTQAPLAVRGSRNELFLIGGTASCGGPTVRTVEKLDRTTNVWTALPASSDLPAPLDGAWHCGAIARIFDKVYYFQSAGIGVFDTRRLTWSVLPPDPLLNPSLFCRATHVRKTKADGRIVITGPGNGSSDANSQRILVFHPTTGELKLLSAQTLPMAGHVAARFSPATLVVAGGHFAPTSVQVIHGHTVTTGPPLPDSRDDAVAGTVHGRMYIAGGHSGSGNNLPPVLIGP